MNYIVVVKIFNSKKVFDVQGYANRNEAEVIVNDYISANILFIRTFEYSGNINENLNDTIVLRKNDSKNNPKI